MEKIKATIEKILAEKDWEINKYQLDFFDIIKLMENPDRLAAASIDMKTNKIMFTVHPDIEAKLDDLISIKGIKKYFSDALVQLTKGITLHEWGHWQGCPLESQKALEMASAASPLVYEFLKEQEIKKQRRETGEAHPHIDEIKKDLVQMQSFWQTNFFMDFVDNALEAHLDDNKEDHVLGMWLFYTMEGEASRNSASNRCSDQRLVAKNVISTIRATREEIEKKQAEASALGKTVQQDRYDNSLGRLQYEIERLRQKEKYNLEYLAEIRQKRKVMRQGKFSKYFTLFLNASAKLYLDEKKESYWKQYYAEDFPELEQETQAILEILLDNNDIAERIAQRKATKEDWNKALHELEFKYEKWADKNKKVVEILLKYLDPDEQPPGMSLNPFFQSFIDNPEGMEDALGALIAQGKPLYFGENDMVYNAIYRQKAQKIVMEEIKKDREAGMVKIKDLSEKKTMIPSLSGINWGKTRIKNANGEQQFEFYKEQVPLQIPGQFPKMSKSLPDILFMVDTSGSMGWAYAENDGNIDTSRNMQSYDLACTAIHSVVNYLEQSKKAAWMKFGAVTFSNETKFSGWKEHKDIKEMFRTLYDKENGGTHLNGNVIDEVLSSKSDQFWAIMVTDGAIGNEAEAIKKVHDLVEQGNYFTLIHIGQENSFCKSIKEKYGEDVVVVINSAEELAGVSLKYTKSIYGTIR